jgi:predicted esterase
VTGEACDYSQWLLLGDPATELARLRQATGVQRDHPSDDAKLDREALVFRFKHLYRQDHYQPGDDEWQQKIVFTLCEYAAELQRRTMSGVLRGRPGTHIRGFRSQIDGQVQYYVVHIPKQLAAPHAGFPVVVLVPYETRPRRPFLESVHIAKIGYAESLARLGRQYGFVVVQVGGRNITDGNPIAEADIREALADLSHDIAIDPRRIYLLGASRGATNALLLAERHPGKFAAVAAVTPLTNLGLHRNVIEDTDSNSLSGSAGDTWLQSNSPVNLVGSLTHTPVYIMAGEDDQDVKLDEIREFVDRCHAFGVYPKVDVVKGMDHIYYPIPPDPIVFDFFSGKVTDDHPASITMQTATVNFGSAWWLRLVELMKPNHVANIEARLHLPHTVELRTSNVAAVRIDLRGIGHVVGGKMLLVWNNKFLRVSTNEPITVALREDCITQGSDSGPRIQGPLLAAFSGPFILVGGDHQSSSSAENLISRLAQKWSDNYFVKCRTMSYGSLSSTDRTENNLVFAPASIVRLPTQLPIESHKDSITVGGVHFAGSSLWYQSLYPNPWNPGKYIVLIGTNNSAAPFCGETDIFTRGRYDVAVWDCGPSNRRLLAVGYWDSEWKTVHSY